MAWTERYANFDLATGSNDGTSEANAWQTWAAMTAGVAAGQRVNIKRQASPWNPTGAISASVDGTPSAPIWYRAYTTTPGDGGLWQIQHAGSLVSFNLDGDYNIWEGLDFSQAGDNQAFFIQGVGSWGVRCRIVLTAGGMVLTNGFRCYVSININHPDRRISFGGLFGTAFYSECIFRMIGSTTSDSLVTCDIYGGSLFLSDCVFWGANNSGQVGLGFNRSNDGKGSIIQRCYFYNFGTHAIQVGFQPNTEYREPVAIYDCVFSSIGGYAVKFADGDTELGYLQLLRNFYHSCTSGFANYSAESQPIAATSLSVSPFVDPANGDFNINNTAGGGAVLRALAGSMDPTL